VSAWAPGARVGVYILGERIGAGAMGSVWSARHQTTGAERALKRLTRATPDLRERFVREGEALARLQHPNVLRVHESFQLEADLVLVTELARGDLSQRLKEGPLSEERAVEVCMALAAGLAAAHEAGILHRDLKPGNVLFGEEERPLLADFGLARLQDSSSLTETGGIMGTPAYISPEAANGKRCDERSDVYGLGAVLYHCLAGRPPFAEGSPISTLAAVVQRSPPPLEGITPEIAATCLRALAKDPSDRFQSATALSQALVALPEDPGSRSPAWVLLLAASLSVLLAALFLGYVPLRPDPVASRTPKGAGETPSPSSTTAPSTPGIRAKRPRGTYMVVARPGELLQAVWQDDQRFLVISDQSLQPYRCTQRGVFEAGDPVRRPGHGELQLFHCVEGGVLLGGGMTPLCYAPFDPAKVAPLSEASDQVLIAEVKPPALRQGRIWFAGERKCKAVDLETREIVAEVKSPFPDWRRWQLRALASLGPDRPVGFYRRVDKTQEAFVEWRVGSKLAKVRTNLAVSGRSATFVADTLWVGTTNRGVVPFGLDLQPRVLPTGFGALRVGRLRSIVATRAGRVFALAETPAKLFEFSHKGGEPIRTLWEGRGTQRGWALSLSPDEGHLLLSVHGSAEAPGEILLVSLD
jgi:serine/threonine protein kinase